MPKDRAIEEKQNTKYNLSAQNVHAISLIEFVVNLCAR